MQYALPSKLPETQQAQQPFYCARSWRFCQRNS